MDGQPGSKSLLLLQRIRLQHSDRFQVDQMMLASSHNEGINDNKTNLCTLLIALNHGKRLYVDKIVIDLRQGSCILVLQYKATLWNQVTERHSLRALALI